MVGGRVKGFTTDQSILPRQQEHMDHGNHSYSSPMASLVLTDSSQLTSDSQHLDVRWWWLTCVLGEVLLSARPSGAVILTPPYFNLAEGRRITATATCGEDTQGPELYCKLVGANADREVNINLIQGQVCDYCDSNSLDKKHPPEYAVDGAETWWQSPPLSRGSKYNEVNLTIDLGQRSEFLVTGPEVPGLIPGASRFLCGAVGLERGQLSLARTNEEIL
uniref:(California timema) hypothetical protein n=1 Tax=Timema californicum TaxID=61474 RepID=A0A7R9P3S8_TIMCA|nr:unnamed protein product [Timema californicum]